MCVTEVCLCLMPSVSRIDSRSTVILAWMTSGHFFHNNLNKGFKITRLWSLLWKCKELRCHKFIWLHLDNPAYCCLAVSPPSRQGAVALCACVWWYTEKSIEVKSSAARWRLWMTNQFGMKWRFVFLFFNTSSSLSCYYACQVQNAREVWTRGLWWVIKRCLAGWLIPPGCRYLECCSMTQGIFCVDSLFGTFGALTTLHPKFWITDILLGLMFEKHLALNTDCSTPLVKQALWWLA